MRAELDFHHLSDGEYSVAKYKESIIKMIEKWFGGDQLGITDISGYKGAVALDEARIYGGGIVASFSNGLLKKTVTISSSAIAKIDNKTLTVKVENNGFMGDFEIRGRYRDSELNI